MNRRRLAIGALVAALFAFPVVAQDGKISAATRSAEEWLALVDTGRYGPSWDEAARFFKGRVSRAQWQTAIRSAREPQGALVSREVRSSEYSTELPGAPDGEYVVLQYSSSFENNKSATETVSLMFEDDRGWRVAGYFIR